MAVDPNRQRRQLDVAPSGSANTPAVDGGSIDNFPLFQMMDDLIDKLLILDYTNGFCLKRDLRPISRLYFATVSIVNYIIIIIIYIF